MFEMLRKQLIEIGIRDFGLLNGDGRILMSDRLDREGQDHPDYEKIAMKETETFEWKGRLFIRICAGRSSFHFFMAEQEDCGHKVLNLIGLHIRDLFRFQMEKFDKNYFIREILEGKIPSGDLLYRAAAFKIRSDMKRVVIVVRHKTSPDYSVGEMIGNIFPDKKENFIVDMGNEEETVYIIQGDEEEACAYARTIVDTLEEELFTPFSAGVGSICNHLQDIGKSYENAKIAMDSAVVFSEGSSIFSFKALGIGKLLFKLDRDTLRNYLEGSVDIHSFQGLDEELIKTLQKFFENNLNISETARQLYLHRNTLVYRIDKVMKQTGLDVKCFDDAVLFQVTYMIKCYLDKWKNS